MTYTHRKAVAAIRSFYEFLIFMYLDEKDVHFPPPGGWPQISQQSLLPLQKTDAVVELLRHIPYTPEKVDICYMTSPHDYRDMQKCLRATSSSVGVFEYYSDRHVPPHVVSLARGHRDGYTILLDTEEDTVTMVDNMESNQSYLGPRGLQEKPFEFSANDDPECWRYRGDTYCIADFFTNIQTQLTQLKWIPHNLKLEHTRDWELWKPNEEGTTTERTIHRLIYFAYGWPRIVPFQKLKVQRKIAMIFAILAKFHLY